MKFLIFATILFAFSGKPQSSEKITTITFPGNKKVKVELAVTMSERYKGLMNRTSLDENSGMLFVFGHPQKLSFWNKNTFIPLSIAYLDDKKVIKEIHLMKAQNMMEKQQVPDSYPSECSCLYALEMNQGWFKKNNIQVGQQVSFTIPSK